MAVADERVERLQRLLDRRRGIEAVDLIEIDMVEPEPLEALLALADDVTARGAARVRTVAHRPEHLGRDHDIVAGDAEVPDRLAEDALALAAGIDIGGVDEVDAGGERGLHQRVGLFLPKLADLPPHALAAAEGHGAEAEFGHEEAAVAELAHTHGSFS